jgi:hypothetical protein
LPKSSGIVPPEEGWSLMSRIIEYPTEDGSILIEVAEMPQSGGSVKAGHRDEATVEKASICFESALSSVVAAANAFVGKAAALATRPDELTVEFSLKTSGKVNAFVISCDAEANFKVSMKWTPGPPRPGGSK